MREDNGDVPDFGDDRIGTVRLTLIESTGMNVDVGYNVSSGPPAMRPEIAKPTTIDLDNAGP